MKPRRRGVLASAGSARHRGRRRNAADLPHPSLASGSSSMHLRLLFAATLCAAPSLVAALLAGNARPWEHESSDVPVDPRIHFGAFDSGMRYAWTDQSKSEDHRVCLRLHVDVGSLVETDAEQGMAHFIEHMAFNGTKNFKAGTLVETFSKEGIQFGHDVNAHTSTEETVFELDLPDASPERLKTAFTWFGDVADGLLFEGEGY